MPGPFYFAWLDGPEMFNPDYHAVEDEIVLTFTVQQLEGEFANLSMLIENPRVGLLSRRYWGILSWDKNWVPAEDHTPDIIPLFMGRLLGIPNTINKETCTLEFIARPLDYASQRSAVAATLRVLPYWDPVYIQQEKWEDPDSTLEAYSRLWSIDRVTHQVSTSDILVGEDGVEDITEGEIPYDGVELTLGTAPRRRVSMEADVTWTQEFEGGVDIIKAKGIHTYTGASLISNWPKPGTDLGGGYVVTEGYAKDLWRTNDAFTKSYSVNWTSSREKHNPGDTISYSASSTVPYAHSYLETNLTSETFSGVGKSSVAVTTLYVLDSMIEVKLSVGFKADRGRKEFCRFILESDVQPILTDQNDEDAIEVKLTGNDVRALLPDGGYALSNKTGSSYFTTPRGKQSLEYLLNYARATLIANARCVEVKAVIPFARAIELSTRKNVILRDYRLPGGMAVGKVKEYSFGTDGTSGNQMGSVTIACAIGNGGNIVANPGTPTYVENGYVAAEYQEYEGQIVVLPAGDVGYVSPLGAIMDDGLRWPLSKGQIVRSEEWHGSIDEQIAAIQAAFPFEQKRANSGQPQSFEQLDQQNELALHSVGETMKDKSIWYELRLKPLERSFEASYNIAVFPLIIPKQIDLEFDGAS